MATLQRSTYSFRRQGSSGLVWEDDKFMRGEFRVTEQDHGGRVLRTCQSTRPRPTGLLSDLDVSSNIDAAPPSACPRSLSVAPHKVSSSSSSSSKGRFFIKMLSSSFRRTLTLKKSYSVKQDL